MMKRGLMLFAALTMGIGAQAADTSRGVCRFQPVDTHGAPTDVLTRLVNQTDPTDQRGLGGTGVIAKLEERGLGGTGIIGVITGFGSICVNGYEVGLTEGTHVNVAGKPAAPGDLRLGQVVALEAYNDGTQLLAARVNIRVAVAGPIEEISTDRTNLIVAGQRVDIAGFGGSVDLSAAQAGDWVVVSGLRRPDDTIAGSSIVRLPAPGREVLVTGTARSTAAGTIAVGALEIESPAIAAGDNVVVVGEIAGHRLAVRDVKVESGSPFSRPMSVVSVQGFGARVMDDLKELGIATGMTPPPDSGVPVQVDGRLSVNGTFVPERIGTPASPVDGVAPRSIDIPVEQPMSTPGGTPGSPPANRPQPNAPNAPQRPTPGGGNLPREMSRPDMPRADRPSPERNPRPTAPDRPQRPEPPAPR